MYENYLYLGATAPIHLTVSQNGLIFTTCSDMTSILKILKRQVDKKTELNSKKSIYKFQIKLVIE